MKRLGWALVFAGLLICWHVEALQGLAIVVVGGILIDIGRTPSVRPRGRGGSRRPAESTSSTSELQ